MKASDVPRAVAAGVATGLALDLRVDDAEEVAQLRLAVLDGGLK